MKGHDGYATNDDPVANARKADEARGGRGEVAA